MAQRKLDHRLQMQIELAISADCRCQRTLSRQEVRARKLALTGVEIDAARSGSSFDVRIACAVALACALKTADAHCIEQAEKHALAVGYTAGELRQIEQLVRSQTVRDARRDA